LPILARVRFYASTQLLRSRIVGGS
jgi:hypothetical protein